jgi:hypothetical protein
MRETILDRLVACLQAALAYNANVSVEPVALLWPDETGQWSPVVRRIRDRLPVVTLGDYDPGQRQGPAYWIRCVAARTIDIGLPNGPLIIYLPGVPRSELRAVDSCPPELAPIAELQYRGLEFTRPKSKQEWSIRGLLTNVERGIGLTIAPGTGTSAALLLALNQLLDEQVDRLSPQTLDADFFNELVNPDPISTLLGWLDEPAACRKRLDDTQWAAFVQQCNTDLGFNPLKDGPITAARKLGERQGAWGQVWRRFADMPGRYPGIAERLRQAKPMDLLLEPSETWPQDNEEAEDWLRKQLLRIGTLTADGAREEALRLNAEHAWRRGTVWADLGLSPLAFAVEQLALLAERTALESETGDLSALASAYAERGWKTDDTALRALGATPKKADREAVAAAVNVIYRPWLDAGAAAFQAAIGPMANAGTYQPGPSASSRPGTVAVFVDGLRLDVAHRILDRLAGAALEVDLVTSLAALPTVTQTAKPVLVPLAVGSLAAGPGLDAANAATGTKASIQVLRSLMADAGIQVLGPAETGDPSGAAWTEVGELDHRGHAVGVRLVDYIDEDIDRVVDRIRELLDAGWQRAEVVTDHGWLLLPSDLDKVELPVSTTELKKGRCARLKDGAVVEVPTVPWFWDQDTRIAVAPGASCFEAGKQYEHGGVSPQECIVPRIVVSARAADGATAGPEITRITWLGLLCRIEVRGVDPGVKVDLRALPGDANTSIAEKAKETTGAGRLSLLVPDEEHEGQRAHLVFVSPDGQILGQREVIVGKNR